MNYSKLRKSKRKLSRETARPNEAPVAYPALSLSSEYNYFYFFVHCPTIIRSSLTFIVSVKSNAVTTSIYAAPRKVRQILCGTN